MFKINLVPEIQKDKNTLAKVNSYATVISVCFIIAAITTIIIMLIINTAQKTIISNTEGKIKTVEEESMQYKELEETVISLEEGLKKVKSVLGYENNWTLLLPHLENATPKKARYGRMIIEDGNTITSQIIGQSIDDLAKFIESYKSYQVISISGSATPGDIITISEGGNVTVSNDDNGASQTIKAGQEIVSFRVGPSGQWTRAVKIDSTKNSSFLIKSGEETESSVSYDYETKNITTTNQVKAVVDNLFYEIETTRYTKSGQEVTFDATFKFETRLIW